MDKAKEKLQEFRNYIDEIDELMAKLLIVRTQVVRNVAQLKAKNWPNSCHIRPAREGQMHEKIAHRFEDTEMPPRIALAMWRQLIGGSTHLESPLNITYLNSYQQHRFLAREYFGVQIGAREASGITEAMNDIRNGISNILVLPHPESHSWWTESAGLLSMGLKIFAYVPVETGILPDDATPAVALAAITPEPSGKDISYFITDHGAIEIVEGFETERPNATFLGAHPKPITLPENS